MDFLAHFFYQFLDFWQKLKTYQRASLFSVVFVLLLFLGFLSYQSIFSNYVPLFTAEMMRSVKIEEVKKYLEESNIPYQIKNNSIVLVPKKVENKVLSGLAQVNILKPPVNKGFELYDSNTWIKGEKELQILEIRALKGQIEHDLTEFEHVTHASVILDIPASRPFGGTANQSKASVILTLKSGSRLSAEEVHAISLHVAGAVRGLTPNMVAISDNSGKLYQAIDSEGGLDTIRNAEMAFEDHLKAKIDGMLGTIVGFENYYSSIQVTMSRDKVQEERKVYSGVVDGVDLGKPVLMSISESTQNAQKDAISPIKFPSAKVSAEEMSSNRTQGNQQLAVPMNSVKIVSSPGKIESISASILVNRRFLDSMEDEGTKKVATEQLQREIENQLNGILKGYNAKVVHAVNFVNFNQSYKALQPLPQTLLVTQNHSNWLEWLAIGLSSLALLLFLLGKKPSLTLAEKRAENENIQPLSRVEHLIEDLQKRYQEDPHALVSTLKNWLHEEDKAP